MHRQSVNNLQRANMDNLPLNEVVCRLNEYGHIYKNIKSDHVKSQLLDSAPEEVLRAYTIATKNILIGNIGLTGTELDHLRQYKESLKKLGFDKCSLDMIRRLLSEGDILVYLSEIMAKLTSH